MAARFFTPKNGRSIDSGRCPDDPPAVDRNNYRARPCFPIKNRSKLSSAGYTVTVTTVGVPAQHPATRSLIVGRPRETSADYRRVRYRALRLAVANKPSPTFRPFVRLWRNALGKLRP